MKQRGRFERRHRLPRLHGGKLALLIACLIQTALSVFCFAMLGHVRGMLKTQSAADVWRGDSEDRFAQISAFLPTTETKTLDDIRSFRATLENEFVQNSMEAPEGGSLYTDAYSGRTSLSVSGKSPGSVTVTAVGHVILVRDVAGMEVTINGRTFPIAGVVQSESDFATNAALAAGNEASGDTSGSSTSTAMIYMSYSALNAMAELPIDCYEIVLPDPVSGFAKKLMTEKFPIGSGAIVQNTGRFSAASLISVIGAFGKRAMTTNGVIYPYWENAARMAESYAALYLLLGTLLAIMPAVCLTIVLVKFITAEIRKGYYKASHAIEDRVEENKRKHYIAGGI